MLNTPFKIIFLIGWLFYETLFTIRAKKIKREKTVVDRKWGWEFVLSMVAFAGMQVVPLVYVFSNALDFANYSLPAWAGWLGAVVFAFGLFLIFRAHADLGRSWSPTVQIKERQGLITGGIYGVIRHPIYAGMWLWAVAQALLLPNWIAGALGLVSFLPIFLYRTPREEAMMIETYGDAYRDYMARVGGLVPRLPK